jgi:hypothetical protein
VRAGSESEGESSDGDSSSDDKDGDKATGHGVDDDRERVLFYGINGGGEGGCSVVIEARDWAQDFEARNTERIN